MAESQRENSSHGVVPHLICDNDLQTALETQITVNRHLNEEVESLHKQNSGLQSQISDLTDRVRALSRLLASEREAAAKLSQARTLANLSLRSMDGEPGPGLLVGQGSAGSDIGAAGGAGGEACPYRGCGGSNCGGLCGAHRSPFGPLSGVSGIAISPLRVSTGHGGGELGEGSLGSGGGGVPPRSPLGLVPASPPPRTLLQRSPMALPMASPYHGNLGGGGRGAGGPLLPATIGFPDLDEGGGFESMSDTAGLQRNSSSAAADARPSCGFCEGGDHSSDDCIFGRLPECIGAWAALRDRALSSGFLIDPSEVVIKEDIARGSFGKAYRALWRGAEVCVKSVSIRNVDECTAFLRECDVLSSLRHPHVVPFLGCSMRQDQTFMIFEFMPGGSLTRWIYGDAGAAAHPFQKPKRSMGDKLRVLLEVARGMQCLQDCNPTVVHRDLKPSNCMVDGTGRIRISDFGLARREAGGGGVLTGETGTYLYMAPEVIRHEPYDSRADVYSWAILAAEVLSQTTPFEGTYLTPVQIAMAVSSGKLRPKLPPSTSAGLSGLVTAAWDADPRARPDFRDITSRLAFLLKSTEEASGAPSMSASSFAALTKALSGIKSPVGLPNWWTPRPASPPPGPNLGAQF